MNDKPYVSIIIPTYNRAYCILDSIKSVLNQTYPYFELLIIDDGSNDNTEEVVCAIDDARVQYFKMQQNSGASAARNYGVSLAKYDYISFQDSDDEWTPDKIEKEMEMMFSGPDVGLVYCQMKCINMLSDLKSEDDNYLIPDEGVPYSYRSGHIFDQLLKANFIGLPTILVKKECIENLGGFDESFHALEDWELILRIAKNNVIGYVDEPLHIYKMGNDESVSKNSTVFWEARCKILGKYKNEMIENGIINDVMEDILVKANNYGVLEQVGKLMEIYLQS